MDRFRRVALFGVKFLFLCDFVFWLFEYDEIEEEEEPSMARRWSSSSRDFLDFGLLLCVGVVPVIVFERKHSSVLLNDICQWVEIIFVTYSSVQWYDCEILS